MMKTTGLLVVFTLLVVLYQTSAVPVATSYKLENENVMDVMEAKEKTEEASDDENAKDDEEEDKSDEEREDDVKNDEEDKDDEDKKEDEEKKEDDEKKDDEESKDDDDKKDEEEKKEDKEEEDDKEEEPDLNDQQNDQDSSGDESVDLDSDHLVLQGSGNGKIKGVVIDDSDKEKDKPEKRSVDDDKKATKSTQEKRCGCGGCGGCGDAFDSGGCDYMGGGCGGAPGGIYGPGCGCGGCGACGTNDWCAGGTMCSNCKGGFGPPVTCSGCNTGCCPSLTFPCQFGATVNNPGCECCKEKTPPGKCKWPCMWPCCCTCTPPKFEFKPLKPEPVCHCPSPHSHHTACGHHCLRRSSKRGPVKRSLMEEQPSPFMPAAYNYGYAPFYNPFFNGVPMMPFPRPF